MKPECPEPYLFDPQAVLDASTCALVLVDMEGRALHVNPAAEILLGVSAHGTKSAFLHELLPDMPQLEAALARCLRHGECLSLAHRCRQGYLSLDISRFGPNEHPRGAVCTIQPESSADAILARQVERQVDRQLDAIFDSSHDGLFITDGQGYILKCNRSSERLIGHLQRDIVGRNVKELVGEGYIDKSVTVEVLKKKTSLTILQKLRNGKTILVTGTPVFDDLGEISFVVTNERDITDLNRMKSQLSQYLALTEVKRYDAYGADSPLYEHGITAIDRLTVRVFQQAEIASKFDATILLQGETGVGKGRMGRFIHDNSPRKNGPFVQINCGAIPEQLIESELFGYSKGAFTGADDSGKPGLFQVADGGTLFLDEISEIPLRFQVKLLKALEDKEILPVGDTRPRKVDVRIIAATNTQLEDLVSKGRFRRDLFFRLNVVPIHIPPLRERSNDIVHLISRFLEKINSKFKSSKFISPEAMTQLLSYPFPGNIRELENIIERVVILCPEDEILPRHLTGSLLDMERETDTTMDAAEGMNLKEALDNYEQRIIRRAVQKHGSKAAAARVLGVDPSTIVRKMQKFEKTDGNAVLHD